MTRPWRTVRGFGPVDTVSPILPFRYGRSRLKTQLFVVKIGQSCFGIIGRLDYEVGKRLDHHSQPRFGPHKTQVLLKHPIEKRKHVLSMGRQLVQGSFRPASRKRCSHRVSLEHQPER